MPRYNHNKIQWLEEKKMDVLKRWKNNQISLIEGVVELVDLGVNVHRAWAILENT